MLCCYSELYAGQRALGETGRAGTQGRGSPEASGAAMSASKESASGGAEKGGIRVAVRLRPAKAGEVVGSPPTVAIDHGKRTVGVIQKDGHGKSQQHVHEVDHVYDRDCRQEDMYAELGVPLLDKLFNWYNGTLFAYGQTGTGKTHSMLGPEGAEGTELEGMIPRMIREIFKRVMLENENRAKSKPQEDVQTELIVKCTYLEIYQEKLVDLLTPPHRNPWDPAPLLKIRQHPDFGVYVEGAIEETVTSYAKMRELMREGDARRQVAAHDLNERSSRSHAVFTIKVIEAYNAGDGVMISKKWARLNMCDLAGSERQKQTHAAGVRLVESSNINKGLMTLQRVIHALAKQGRPSEINVVPFRESKLTQLLEESLGGTALCCMIACASPAQASANQTALTLRYAASARQIRKTVVQNRDITETDKLKGEVQLLMVQLADAEAKNKMEAARKYEEKISKLEQVLAAEARARAEWQAALLEERRRAMLNASVPGRVAMFLQDISSPAAEDILHLENRIRVAEAEYYQILQLVANLEDAVQREVDALRPTLPNVDDSSLERLVVQLRTVQGESHKLKALRDDIVALYTELGKTASREATRLIDAYPELAHLSDDKIDGGGGANAQGSGDVTGDGAFIEGNLQGDAANGGMTTEAREQIALQGVQELQLWAVDGAVGISGTGGNVDVLEQPLHGFKMEELMEVVDAVEEAHEVNNAKTGVKPAASKGGIGMGGTARVSLIDYAVDTLDTALANFRRNRAAAFEDFMAEFQALQEQATRVGQLLELKDGELTLLREERDDLQAASEEANSELDRLQAAMAAKDEEFMHAVDDLKAKNKALKRLRAQQKTLQTDYNRVRDELKASTTRQSEADRRVGELTAEVTRFRSEAARFKREVAQHQESASTADSRRDATQAELSELQKKFNELQVKKAVEGKSQEYAVKSLEEAQEERAALRDKVVDLQREVDELRSVNMSQQEQLVDHQQTKIALAEAKSEASMAAAKAEHANELLALGAKDKDLLDIVKTLLEDQNQLRKSLSTEEIAKLQEQKALLSKEVEVRQAAMERSEKAAEEEREAKAKLQRELDEAQQELERLQKKSKMCSIM